MFSTHDGVQESCQYAIFGMSFHNFALFSKELFAAMGSIKK